MPKSLGLHPSNALTALKVKQVTKPGKYADGNGLYLVVDKSGAKRWLLRITVQGRRRDIGLGGVSLTSLAEARELAYRYRKIAREGGDPLEERRQERLIVPTFQEAALAVHKENEPTWANAKHAQQWINTLETYAFPIIGKRQVDQIETSDILLVLSPIWLTKPETARRVRQRMSKVFDWAKASGFRSGDNPVSGVSTGLPKQLAKQQHFSAMPYSEVPEFVKRLQDGASKSLISSSAFEFLILTALRTTEVLHASWDEVDFENRVLRIADHRMKMKKSHNVPLSDRAIEILRDMEAVKLDENYVFPGMKKGRPFSNMVFLKTLERMELPYTGHGFRSSFRDWVAETTNYPRDLAEMALAHAIQDKTEAAYRRGDMLERRRPMMNDWADYVASD